MRRKSTAQEWKAQKVAVPVGSRRETGARGTEDLEVRVHRAARLLAPHSEQHRWRQERRSRALDPRRPPASSQPMLRRPPQALAPVPLTLTEVLEEPTGEEPRAQRLKYRAVQAETRPAADEAGRQEKRADRSC
jgi:hypothetical protein